MNSIPQVAQTWFTGRQLQRITPLIMLGLLAVLCGCGGSSGSFAQTVHVTTFAKSVKGKYTQPDSVTFNATNVFVGYSNGVAKDGSDGKSSTIVEFTMDGKKVTTFKVKGHNDGLKIDPATGLLWAMQNEDGNPNLVIIDVTAGTQTVYTFSAVPCGGGFDDVVFDGGKVFMSCSNPAHNPNTDPAIVSVTLVGTTATVSPVPVLLGNASAVNIVTGKTVTLNLQDPDSMILDPSGVLVLDSQADSELVFITNPDSPGQTVKVLPITFFGTPTQIDDTVFPTSPVGTILVADLGGETVYAIHGSSFPTSGRGFSATGPEVSQLNLATGALSVVINALVSSHGMAFIPRVLP
jgi:hypothetical protein